MDEVTSGLDPETESAIWESLRRLHRELTMAPAPFLFMGRGAPRHFRVRSAQDRVEYVSSDLMMDFWGWMTIPRMEPIPRAVLF